MSNTLINQAMKRLLTLGLMLASAFALTNCAEQLDTPDQEKDIIVDVTDHEYGAGDPYEIYVDDVDTKTNYTSAGKTVWSNGDKILVYSKPAGSADGYIGHGQYEYCTLNDGRKGFKGYLGGTLSNKNDWYFIYTDSSSASTTAEGTVSIGAGAIQQDPSEDPLMYVMSSSNCPLWGMDNRVDKNDRPRFKMKYLYSVVAVEIINQGAGENIAIRDIELKANEGIVGNFKVNIGGEMPIYTSESGTSTTTSIALSSPKVIEYGKSATFYFAVKPFTLKSGSSLIVKVNSSSRKLSKETTVNFEAGKITKLSVDVTPLTHPTDNDALNMTSGGKKVFDMSKATSKTMTVNGENVTGYILGEGSQESITVTGTVKDLMNALDVGFYASSWKGQRIAMTVNHLNLWIDGTQFANYQPFLNAIKADLGIGDGWGDKIKWAAMEAGVKLLFSSGVDRTGTLMGLTDFMDPSTITFVGVVENGTPAPASGETPNIVLINENEINKVVSSDAVENLLETKFDYKQADGTMLIPSFEGLNDIINGNPNSTEANETANAIYNKLQAAIGNKSFSASGIGTLHVWKIFQGIFSSAEDMKAKLPNLKVSVDIATIPYSAEKGAYGTKGNPITPSGAYNPIVIWGLDVTTAEEKQQMGN